MTIRFVNRASLSLLDEKASAAFVLACLFVVAAAQLTVAAWVPVMEDSVDLKLTVSSLALDTVHFPGPVLLVGTFRDTGGLSLILRVDPLTLQPLDTLYSSTYVPKVCRAADLNFDSQTDLLMSLTSVAGDSQRFSSVVAAYGPDFETADTLALPRTAVDLLIDEDRREIWYGYAHDTTTFHDYGGCIDYSWRYIGFGGAVGFDLTELQVMGGGFAAIAFALSDVNSDHVDDITALWTWASRGWGFGCGPQPSPSRGFAGVWRRDGAALDTLLHTWVQYYNGFDIEYIQMYPQLLLADLNLDGSAEAVLSWHHAFFRGYDSLHVAAFSLASGASLWRKVQPYPAFGIHYGIVPPTAILYDVDDAAPPEVLIPGVRLVSGGPLQLLALRGDTGDTLFATNFRYVSSLNVTYRAAAHEPTHVIHAAGSWLYRWRVDLGAGSGSDEFLPRKFDLKQPAPNPFNAGTRIAFSLIAPLDVNVSVFDVLGRHVIALAEGVHSTGDHEVVWDGYSRDGTRASSGVYFVRIQADGDYAVRRMCMIK